MADSEHGGVSYAVEVGVSRQDPYTQLSRRSEDVGIREAEVLGGSSDLGVQDAGLD